MHNVRGLKVQHSLFVTIGMLLPPKLKQEWRHLGKNCLRPAYFRMTRRAKRNHQMEYGFSWYAMMNNDGTFASPRSSAYTAAIAISL
jgi:hypothetical protein